MIKPDREVLEEYLQRIASISMRQLQGVHAAASPQGIYEHCLGPSMANVPGQACFLDLRV